MKVVDLTRCLDGGPHKLRRNLIFGCCPRHGVEVHSCVRPGCGFGSARGGLADHFGAALARNGGPAPIHRGPWDDAPSRWNRSQRRAANRFMDAVLSRVCDDIVLPSEELN